MLAADLLASVFPDAAACLENIPGDREIPDHPLVAQVLEDCLHEAMDVGRFLDLLGRLDRGEITYLARDLPEPSPLAHEILNAKPYAFLDDAPLEERRTQAVQTRRALEPTTADDLGALDQSAIARVRDEAWPDPENPDELYDTLQVSGYLTEAEGKRGRDGVSWSSLMRQLEAEGRAVQVRNLWVAVERLDQVRALPQEEAIRELLRGRMEIVGPTTTGHLAGSLGISRDQADAALIALETEGVVLRGRFTQSADLEWCDRRLLARIHRYTLNRLRAEIEPVSSADFARFLFSWQKVEPSSRMQGLEGLAVVVDQLEAFEAPGPSWEADLLGSRMIDYDPQLLDLLCLSGRVSWGRLSVPGRAGESSGPVARPIRSTPISLFLREHGAHWMALAAEGACDGLSTYAGEVLKVLESRGASFFAELAPGAGLLPTQVEQALGELAAAGLVTSDSFAGLRALLTPSARRKPMPGGTRRHRTVGFSIERAGRWSAIQRESRVTSHESRESFARLLLKRYGVVFNRLLTRESLSVPWRELLMIYRRLEARGEIRGGRFVAGVTGEQFALPEAVVALRAARRAPRDGHLVSISATDPLNLLGTVFPGDRVPALAANRVVFEDGVALAVLEAGKVRGLAELPAERVPLVERALARRPISPALRALLGIPGRSITGTEEKPRRRARQKTST
jgi:ATP-dependent Lhr-like helicase